MLMMLCASLSGCQNSTETEAAPSEQKTLRELLLEIATAFEQADHPVQILVQPMQLKIDPTYHEVRHPELCTATLYFCIAWADPKTDSYPDHFNDHQLWQSIHTVTQTSEPVKLEARLGHYRTKTLNICLFGNELGDDPWNSFPHHGITESGTKVVLLAKDYVYQCDQLTQGEGVINISTDEWEVYQRLSKEWKGKPFYLVNKPWLIRSLC